MKRNILKLVGVAFLTLSLLAMPLTGGCGPKESEFETEPIVLAYPAPMGNLFATEAERAVLLAIEEINAAGGVNIGGEMRPFTLVVADSRDSAPGVPTSDSLAAIKKLILEEKPHAIVVGPNRSEVMLAAMELNTQYKMPQIGCHAASPAFNAKVLEDPEKYKYNFRMATTSLYIVKYHTDLAEYIREQFGYDKVFFLHQDVMWATASAQYLGKVLGDLGWEVLGTESIPVGTTDFAIPLLKARDSGAQLVGMFFDMYEVAQLFEQFATLKVPAIPFGVVNPPADPDAWELYDGKVEGLIVFIAQAGAMPVPSMPKSVEFWEAYKARWGEPIRGIAGQPNSYDAVYVFKDAMERAGSLDPDAIVEALRETDMQGVMGRIRFDESNQSPYGYDPEEMAIGLFFQWQQPGERKTVFPLAIAEADIVLPPWMR